VTIAFFLLFSIASAVALATRRLKVPYTVALVVVGFALGRVHPIDVPHLTRELLFYIFLPGLLFEAAFHLAWRDFRANARAILALSVPGVVGSIALTALALLGLSRAFHLALSVDVAVVFGAVVAATDPIAVVSIFRALGAPKRLTVLIEGESLLNDGTAVVLFSLVLASTQGDGWHLGSAVLDFVRVSGCGVLVGLAMGFVLSEVIKRIDDPPLEIALTAIAAYGSFIIADRFEWSGVLATVTAGMVCGSYGAPRGMSASTRTAVESFWAFVAFALNSLVFLLVGVEGSSLGVLRDAALIACALGAMLVARLIVVGAVGAGLRKTRERLEWSWVLMLTWGGLRGALSMVLALALPQSYAGRGILIVMTSGAVMLSIVLQGLTASRVLGALRIARRGASAKAAPAET
jgi:CPA1 family monovalent cation:H+ antiporter